MYDDIVGPALIDNDGWTWFIGTPKGRNNFYDIYNLACEQVAKGNKKWFAFKETVLTSKNHDGSILYNEEALETYKLRASQNKYEQEMLCSFNATVDGAVYEKEIANLHGDDMKRIRKGIFDPNLDVYTIWDVGMSDATAIIFVQFNWKEVRIINYIEDTGQTLDYYTAKIRDLARTRKYHYAAHYFPHDMNVREYVAGSRIENARKGLEGLGSCLVTPKVGIEDGIEAARMMFGNCYFEEEATEELIAALSFYHRELDDKKNVLDDKPEHDWSSHAADAFRYLGVNYKSLTRVDEPRMIKRQSGLEHFLR